MTWPGLIIEAVTKYLPKLFATTQGHINQQVKNIHSTTIKQEYTSAKPTIVQLSPSTKGIIRNYKQIENSKNHHLFAIINKLKIEKSLFVCNCKQTSGVPSTVSPPPSTKYHYYSIEETGRTFSN